MNFREMTARDRRFVVPTWALGSRYDGLLKHDRFTLVDRILDRGARCVVAGSESGAVHAWACAEGDLLHYVYVPFDLRGEGLARKVITHLFGRYPDRIDVTHPWPGESKRFRFHQLTRIAA